MSNRRRGICEERKPSRNPLKVALIFVVRLGKKTNPFGQGKVDWSLLLLFTPMWTCVVVASSLRCITPPSPQVRHAVDRKLENVKHRRLVCAHGPQPSLTC